MRVTLVVHLATQRAVVLALELEPTRESCLQVRAQVTAWRRTHRPRRGLTKRRAKIPDSSSDGLLKLLLKRGRKRCSSAGTSKASIEREVDSSLIGEGKVRCSLHCLRFRRLCVPEEQSSEGSNVEFGMRRELSQDVAVVGTVLEGTLT
jgi:hypothetical protein